MSSEFKKMGLGTRDKLMVDLLEEMAQKLGRIIELLEQQGRVRPS